MIISAAVKFEMTTAGCKFILAGVRHGDCYKQLKDIGVRPSEIVREATIEGFLDNKGRFLDRKEALEHAIECGQLCTTVRDLKENSKEEILFSEDLW